jgi:hypothetical protein
MIRIQQGQGKRAGLNTSKIHRDKSETSSQQILGRQLDPRDLVVVAHSQIGESQLPQGRFGAFNLAQFRRRNGMVVGNP